MYRLELGDCPPVCNGQPLWMLHECFIHLHISSNIMSQFLCIANSVHSFSLFTCLVQQTTFHELEMHLLTVLVYMFIMPKLLTIAIWAEAGAQSHNSPSNSLTFLSPTLGQHGINMAARVVWSWKQGLAAAKARNHTDQAVDKFYLPHHSQSNSPPLGCNLDLKKHKRMRKWSMNELCANGNKICSACNSSKHLGTNYQAMF